MLFTHFGDTQEADFLLPLLFVPTRRNMLFFLFFLIQSFFSRKLIFRVFSEYFDLDDYFCPTFECPTFLIFISIYDIKTLLTNFTNMKKQQNKLMTIKTMRQGLGVFP